MRDKARNYETVTSRHIGRIDETERLYQLEEKLGEAVKAAATELQALVIAGTIGGPREGINLYSQAVPETIAMLCDMFGGGLQLRRPVKEKGESDA